jgi:hypothetical protein
VAFSPERKEVRHSYRGSRSRRRRRPPQRPLCETKAPQHPRKGALRVSVSFSVAKSSRRGDRICRAWYPENQINFSVIVIPVAGTGDKIVYCTGRSKGHSRTQTSRGGPQRGRRHVQGLKAQVEMLTMRDRANDVLSQPPSVSLNTCIFLFTNRSSITMGSEQRRGCVGGPHDCTFEG